MKKISLVINTLNEEKNLPFLFKSVGDFADEIIVCDMKSSDSTRKIAKKYGAKVYLHDKTEYVEPARNFALSKATGDWILILDSDERLTSRLIKKLKDVQKEGSCDYVRIPRKNIIFGKWVKHTRFWPDYNIRFFKKGKVSWTEIIHGVPMTVGVGKDLLPKEKYAIVHHNYKTLEQYLMRMIRYTKIQSKNIITDGYKFDWRDVIKKPTLEFYSRYFSGRGYKDGLHGLVLSLLQAFSELVLYLRLWENEKFTDIKIEPEEVFTQVSKMSKDYNYWKADTIFKKTKKFVYRLKRRLKLP